MTPAVLPPLDPEEKHPRLLLAEWLVSEKNPLTPRVTVNRMWQEFFGRGIVRTAEDFGTQGEAPTHPALLDWLASEFVARGWSQKEIHRLIVTSATYRQSSRARPGVEEKNPGNKLLARQNRLRLPAELVRDNALQVSGLLYPEIGGKSVFPPQPVGVAGLGYSKKDWVVSIGAGPLSPRDLYSFSADDALSDADEFRRAEYADDGSAACEIEHCFAGTEPAQRSRLLRSRPRARGAGVDRSAQ